jgi:soluble lytic murein transglycosylase-like protein
MPEYAQSFADKCGIGKLTKGDLFIPEINLHVGACQYMSLLRLFRGDMLFALAAYNSGQNSKSVRALIADNREDMHPETRDYVEKYEEFKLDYKNTVKVVANKE